MIFCEHSMPGRLRLKTRTPSSELLQTLRQSLLALPGIRAVEARPTTGSLIIYHDASISGSEILGHAGVSAPQTTPSVDTLTGRLGDAVAGLVIDAAMEHLLGKPAMTLLKAIL